MKDQWLKDIRDRMADFETEEPAGLWDDIESGLTVTPTVGNGAVAGVLWYSGQNV